MNVSTAIAHLTEQKASLVRSKTIAAWKMTKADVLRCLWYVLGTDGPTGTVALLECSDLQEAWRYREELPFVTNEIVDLEVVPLPPTSFSWLLLFLERHERSPVISNFNVEGVRWGL